MQNPGSCLCVCVNKLDDNLILADFSIQSCTSGFSYRQLLCTNMALVLSVST